MINNNTGKCSSSLAKNLSSLLNQCGFEPEVVMDAFNISNDQILQLLSPNACKSINMDLSLLADFFCISVEELQGIKTINPDRIPGTYQPKYLKNYSAPLLHWDFNIDEYLQLDEETKRELPQVTTNIKVSEKAFALAMGDKAISPRFPQGTLLIFDPAVDPKNNNFVLVSDQINKKCLFGKVLKNDIQNEFVFIENGKSIIAESKSYRIVGTFLQAMYTDSEVRL